MRRKLVLSILFTTGVFLCANVSPAVAEDAILEVSLTGSQEPAPPGPGDPDAAGLADIYIDDDTNQLCLFLEWKNVDGTLSGLHIHRGPAGVNGPIVVPFATPPTSANSTFQCVTVASEALLDEIAANPSAFYLNLHSQPLYPGGAIRGQLQFA